MTDLNLALLCIYAAGVVLLLYLEYRWRRKAAALRAVKPALQRNQAYLEQQYVTMVQQAEWNPHDPKNVFLAEHLRHKVREHRALIAAVDKRLKEVL